MFAIVETSGSQFKVEKGLSFDVHRIDEEEGTSITLDKVILINDEGNTKIGNPYLDGAQVTAKISAHKRGDKIIVFKMKAKKRYQKTQGHRDDLTTIEIIDIKG